jgi:signal transduction histidine kinase
VWRSSRRAERSRSRRLAWLLLFVAWLPIWAAFTALILVAHPNVTGTGAVWIGFRLVVAGALLGEILRSILDKLPWPRPLELRFVALQGLIAALYSICWLLLNSLVESLVQLRWVFALGPGLGPNLVMGIWLYGLVAGVVYANQATERAARAEAVAAESQLAALRAQLNPHFLFNALHGIIQLIAPDPQRAASAAEQLAGLLRTTIEEDRDLIPLAAEWAFVERYLALEQMRYGDRLILRTSVSDDALDVLLPSFALQTLVENAVRHGAGPSIGPTEVAIEAVVANGHLLVRVRDNGPGADPGAVLAAPGSGLRRLRERLAVLYGGHARLGIASVPGHGLEAILEVPGEAE